MSGSESNPKASLPLNTPMNNNNTTITPSDTIQQRRRMVRNYSLLYLDECMDEANQEYESLLTQLQTNTDNVDIFKQRDECVDFLTDAEENIKSFLVLENTIAQYIMPLVNDIPQLHSVYIFGNNKPQHEEWTAKWQKIKSVHTNIDDLCEVLQTGIKQFNQDSIAMSFITVNEMASTGNLNQLEPTFMYTQIFKDILLDMKHDEQAIKQFIDYCRKNNSMSPITTDRFVETYQTQSAIWCYTSFNIYSMLNYALRTLDADAIITMVFFMCRLHQQIQQLHQQQFNTDNGEPFIVYRGQGLMKSDFEKLQKLKGGLMSFNNFLSTSTDKAVSLEFAQCASAIPDAVGILFIMSIDPCIKSTPFASIKEESYFKEEDEILFSMHTVFRVSAIKQMDNKNQLYQVELELTSDDDHQLRLLTDRIREEASGSTGWERLGTLLLKISQFNKAEELYNVLLEQTSDESEKAYYYHHLGYVKNDQGDYEKAIWYYEQAVEIRQKTLPSNHPDLATSYNNIGSVYNRIGEYLKALSYYEKALEIRETFLPSSHPDLASSYNNIGSVYNRMGEYSKALSFYDKALEIYQKTLLSNHPHLAISYNNISNVYDNMGEYSKALSFYEKALEIREKFLPSYHPDLASLYNNIGSVYNRMGEYSNALSFYEKTLEILEKALPSNHPYLAISYNNIGLVYNNMGEYSKALSYYEKDVEICQKTFRSNRPSLAISYNNIGLVYNKMGEYSKALSYYEKALEILEKTLPSSHPHLAKAYNNIGWMYRDMKDYSKALSYLERAMDVFQRVLPPTHSSIKTVKNSIEVVKEEMTNNS
ncbi:unnamed protein product [Adineta steineri]|uniref:NAD(P)(+)--arginine ADP-ribosyltransferase n=1 Tax=Adineta steineri TaxID=433720 RepID=A0A818HIB1_9BILA|nr:unnamed protein product [Adineta steineri]CAF3509224.1 unnamed protein product [Adineta steineri]